MNLLSKATKRNIQFYMKTTPKKKKKSHIRKSLQKDHTILLLIYSKKTWKRPPKSLFHHFGNFEKTHWTHGLIFRTSGKDWRNEDHHTSRSTTPPASSPTWAPTTATPVSSTVRSVTISYSSSSSHQSSSRATSKQTTDRLPTKKTTSTPKLSTTMSTLIAVLVTTAVLGTCLGIITIFKKYINGQRQVMAAEENTIFLNPLFSEETEV